jgi:hypothetical protein
MQERGAKASQSSMFDQRNLVRTLNLKRANIV